QAVVCRRTPNRHIGQGTPHASSLTTFRSSGSCCSMAVRTLKRRSGVVHCCESLRTEAAPSCFSYSRRTTQLFVQPSVGIETLRPSSLLYPINIVVRKRVHQDRPQTR
ncbi:unnamed protein product, partial [Scytosiphon promiscuus]